MRTHRHVPRIRQRAHAFPVFIAALLLASLAMILPVPTHAALVTDPVTSCASSGPGSLPAALDAADAGDTIVFLRDCTDDTTITLTAPLVPSVNVTIDATALPHTVTISGGDSVRLFTVNPGITLSLRGLTLAHGSESAIFNPSGTVNITGCTFADNTARSGGAINSNGTVNVINSTFSGNTASDGLGGAIENNSGGTLNVVGSSFSGNVTSDRGGIGGSAIINTGTFRLTLSVVAGNIATNRNNHGPDILGVVNTDGGGNVVGDTTGSSGLTALNDMLNADPLFAPLADNGGPVQTFALLPGSPAIAIAACPTDPITMLPLATDARGVGRPQGASCDAGSYQTAASP